MEQTLFKTSTHMPESKRPIVAIVAAHERRKTVDSILNSMSFTTEVKFPPDDVMKSFQSYEPTRLANAEFHYFQVNTRYMITFVYP